MERATASTGPDTTYKGTVFELNSSCGEFGQVPFIYYMMFCISRRAVKIVKCLYCYSIRNHLISFIYLKTESVAQKFHILPLLLEVAHGL